MTYQFSALDYAPFEALFELTEEELEDRSMRRVTADSAEGFPCRVSLQDAHKGENLILTNFKHLDVASPYAATHAVYVREGAQRANPAKGDIPQTVAKRLVSLRAFGADGYMRHAEVAEGAAQRVTLEAMFADPMVSFVDAHSARAGCFMARATRA